ncbi:ATP-dependent DNA ligase [Thermogymnomonas acidicola]|uniref:DNA ligase n=1 Tax=Thermogymnomonas acidicola TaxID=399579 RepID=A0AA37FC74_9ARCH|nr:ATP-dependent DNA ligase [Thermogymnomonas acidicola]GGM78307.1 ATP-dependent DNA ligase [Thermogymnomonas acidicola]
MLFSEATEVFEKMSRTTKRLELTSLLSELLKRAGDDLEYLVYLVQGKLLPDYRGVELGMAEQLILRALSEVSSLDGEEIEEMYRKTGDLGELAGQVVSSRAQGTLFRQELTVKYVYDSLMKVATSSGQGSIRVKMSIYKDLIMNSDPRDAVYITRIINGKLRLGVSDATILDALTLSFAEPGLRDGVSEAYNFYPDLAYIARLLREGRIDDVLKIGPQPGVPVKVMLAERLSSVHEIMEKMGGRAAFEFKYDGIRVQVHVFGGQVRIFSRGLEETTGQFPDIVRAVKEEVKVESAILDGEAVPVNPETGEIYPFQVVSQRRGRKHDLERVSEEVPIVVFFFDIIYLNGRQLHREAYGERRRLLRETVRESERLRIARTLVSSDEGEVERFFNESIEYGCEGLVAKSLSENSIYRAGARGWLWIKLKRDYEAEMSDSLDLVVVGAFSGHGRRGGTYGALLMAAYDQEKDEFVTVCKLGSGFNDEMLFSLPKMFQQLVTKEKPARVNSIMEPDFWIYPSVVLEVRGAEITLSPVHTCAMGTVARDSGLALRFPRFTGKIRNDKKPEDATSVMEILEMFRSQKKKSVGE